MAANGATMPDRGEKEVRVKTPELAVRDTRTHMLFADMVPRRGLGHEHGAQGRLRDLQKLRYHVVRLKCDGEPAFNCVWRRS